MGVITVWGGEKHNGGFFVRVADTGKAAVVLRATEDGGYVSVFRKDGSIAANMDVGEHGGRIGVFGNNSNITRAVIAVNEYGNGAVSTWDKNGYLLK